MANWGEFEAAAPALALWGAKRLNRSRVAYLATTQPDGSPCVQTVMPVIAQGRLYLFMDQNSCWDGRYVMHSLVDNPAGIGGEFQISGYAVPVDDLHTREEAVKAACYTPANKYLLYELIIERAYAADYEDSTPREIRWNATLM